MKSPFEKFSVYDIRSAIHRMGMNTNIFHIDGHLCEEDLQCFYRKYAQESWMVVGYGYFPHIEVIRINETNKVITFINKTKVYDIGRNIVDRNGLLAWLRGPTVTTRPTKSRRKLVLFLTQKQ